MLLSINFYKSISILVIVHMIKKEIRIIAWDDCRFKFHSKNVRIVGVVFRGGAFIDGLLSVVIKKDGVDATEKIATSILKSRHYDQLSLIMLDGISFAGFNLVDIKELYNKTKLPVMVLQRKKPDIAGFIKTLKIFQNYNKRKNIVKKAGKFYIYVKEYKDKRNPIFYQKYGLTKEDAEKVLKITCIHSSIPEPLRVAHIIASGLSGESSGRA